MKIPSKNHPAGSALVLVIFITALLGGIVVSTLFLIKGDVEKQRKQIYASEVDALANEALSYGAHPQIERDDPLLNFTSEDGFESYSVALTTEDSKLSINAILARDDKALLRRLFEYWGMEPGDAENLVDAMTDWIDGDDVEQLNGAERDTYEALGFTDRPYNNSFQKLSEMALVLGFADLEAVKPDWKESFTIYSDGRLDIYEASEDLLIAAAEVQQSQAYQFQSTVRGVDDIFGTDDDTEFGNVPEALASMGVLQNGPNYEVITSRLKLGGTTKRIECLARVAVTEKEVVTIVEQRGDRSVILFQEEKIRDTVSLTRK